MYNICMDIGEPPELPPGKGPESSEDAETEKIDKIFSEMKSKLARAKEVGVTAVMAGPTNFVRSDSRIDSDSTIDILSKTDQVLNAVVEKNIQKTTLPEQGDIKYLWETEGQAIIAHAIVPDPNKSLPGTTRRQLDAVFDTWGIHDVVLYVWTADRGKDPEFELNVLFDDETLGADLEYKTGRKKFKLATVEEGEIMKYYLNHLQSTIAAA